MAGVEHLQQWPSPDQPLAALREGAGQVAGRQLPRGACVAEIAPHHVAIAVGLLLIHDRAIAEVQLAGRLTIGTPKIAVGIEEAIGAHQASVALLQQAAAPLHHLPVQWHAAAAGGHQQPVESVTASLVGGDFTEAGHLIRHRLLGAVGGAQQRPVGNPRCECGEQNAVGAAGHGRKEGNRAHLGSLALGDARRGIDGRQELIA